MIHSPANQNKGKFRELKYVAFVATFFLIVVTSLSQIMCRYKLSLVMSFTATSRVGKPSGSCRRANFEGLARLQAIATCQFLRPCCTVHLCFSTVMSPFINRKCDALVVKWKYTCVLIHIFY